MKAFNSILTFVVLLGLLLQPVASAQDATPEADETTITASAAEPTPEETVVETEPAAEVGEESTPDIDASAPTAEATSTESLPEETPDQTILAEGTGTVVFNPTLPAEDTDGAITIEIMGQNVDYYDWDVLVSTGTTLNLPVGTYQFSWYGDGYTYNGDVFTVTANATATVNFTPVANGFVTFTVNIPGNVPDGRIRIIISKTSGGEAYDSVDSNGSYPVTFTLPAGTWYWRTSALGLTGGGSGSFTLALNQQLPYTVSPTVSGTAFPVTVDVNPAPYIDLTGQIACIFPSYGTYWARRCITLNADGTGNFGPLPAGTYIVAVNENGLYPLIEVSHTVSSSSPKIIIGWDRRDGGSVTFTPNFPSGMSYAFVLVETSNGGYAGGNFYLWDGSPVTVSLVAGNYRYGFMDPYSVTPEYVNFTVTNNSTTNVVVGGADVTLNIKDDRGGSLQGFNACVMGREYGYSQCTTLGQDGSFPVGLMAPGSYQVVLSGGDSVHADTTLTLNVTSASTYALVWPTSAAAIAVNPTTGQAGTSATVTGTGFYPNDVITLRWGGSSGAILGTVTTDTKGDFSTSVSIPSTAGMQSYTIAALGTGGRSANATYTVTQLAPVTVSLSTTSGQAGSTVKVSGTGFQPGETVTIRWNGSSGTSLGTVTAGTNGAFTNKDVTIPATASKQTYAIWATAPSGQQGSASYTVNQLAQVVVTLNPTSGQAGTTTKVSGSGFQPGETVTIRWNGSSGTSLGTVTASADGTFANKDVTIPVTAAKQSYAIWATAPSGQQGSANYTVNQLTQVSISLNPTSGQAGTTTKVSGTGFQPGEIVTIRWNGSSGTSLGTVTAGSDGTFANKDVTIPVTANKQSYAIWATAPSGQQGNATYTVNKLATVSVLLSPASGKAGTTTTFSGSGFLPGELVTIRWGGSSGTILSTVAVGADGRYSVPLVVPVTSAMQGYSVYASAPSGQTGSATYTVTQLADVSVALSSSSGQAGKSYTLTGEGFLPSQQVTVRWDAPSGTQLAVLTPTSSGSISGSITVPADAAKGTYTLYVSSASGQATTTTFTVDKLAGATITLSVGSGQAGTITKISGSGFEPGELITIRWGGSSGAILRSFNAGTTGKFMANTTIPATATLGQYEIYVSSVSGQTGSAFYTVTQLAGAIIAVNPASGAAGSRTTVTGSGFEPGELITIRWGGSSGAVLRSFNAGTTGKFSAGITIPDSAVKQSYVIYVSSASGQSGSTTFAVTQTSAPIVTVSPSTGAAGSRATVTGSGFEPGELITLRWGGSSGSVLRSFNAGTTGKFSAGITIPTSASKQTYVIYASSASGKAGSTTYTVNQVVGVEVTLSPTSGAAGSRITMTGSGFVPGELITIRWGGSSGTVLRSFNAGTTGKFSAGITIPASASRQSYVVYVSSASGKSGSATFTVTASALMPIWREDAVA